MIDQGFALSLDPVDFDAFFDRLPRDPRRDEQMIDDLAVAVWQLLDAAMTRGQHQTWLDDISVKVSTTTSLWQRRAREVGGPAVVRGRLERYAWALAWLLDLDAARRPDAHQLDLEWPLPTRHAVLLWLHGQFDDAPWQDFDFDTLTACFAPAPDAIGLALWRMATRSEFDRLREPHRRALDAVRKPGGLGALAVEEGRRLAERTHDPRPLERVAQLLWWDRQLSERDADALRRLDDAWLALAWVYQLHDLPGPASDYLHSGGFGSDETPAQQLTRADVETRLALLRGAVDIAGRRLARTPPSPSIDAEQRAERHAVTALHRIHAGRFDDAATECVTALDRLAGWDDTGPDALMVELTGRLVQARFEACLQAAGPELFTVDPRPDMAERVEPHRDALLDARESLEAHAAAWMRHDAALGDGVQLAHYRWFLARTLTLDDAHASASYLLGAAGLIAANGPAETAPGTLRLVARDLVALLRLGGVRRDRILATEPLRRLAALEPTIRDSVEVLLAIEPMRPDAPSTDPKKETPMTPIQPFPGLTASQVAADPTRDEVGS